MFFLMPLPCAQEVALVYTSLSGPNFADPITGDIMLATTGHPGILADAPSFVDKTGMTNNTHVTVDPITGYSTFFSRLSRSLISPH